MTYEQACADARTRPAYREAQELLKMQQQRETELEQIEKLLNEVSMRDEMAWAMAVEDDTTQALVAIRSPIDNLWESEEFVLNHSRRNRSAREQGLMYLYAKERGLFPSTRKLAEAVGVDVAHVQKAISEALASLGAAA